MTNPQSKIPKELEKIKNEIKDFGEKHKIEDSIDINRTMNTLKSANERIIELINVLTKIKERLK